ncbi:MAG: PAS domain S-box protein [Proteobacteria bacterium]|nr:MAG: PAS domain S-box protein [Pseudomonadota bacterium]QKK11695.1 MAG: sigma 54-interacting transcriptional regulator [Pseudomonadota bacterium]
MNSPVGAGVVNRLCATLDRLGKGYAWFDARLRLLAWNDAYAQLLALPAEVLTLRAPLQSLVRFRAERGDYGTSDVEALIDEQLARCRANEAVVSEQQLGAGSALRIVLQPLAELGVLQICEDISEAYNARQALLQSEERYDFAMRAINEGVYDWDLGDDTVYYSTRVREALGLAPEQLRTANDWGSRIHPDDFPIFRAAYVAHVKGETGRFECDFRYRAQDGSWRWARQHGLALRDGSGRACRIIGSTGDITELKQAELELGRARDALEEQNQRLRAEIEAHRRSQATIEYLVDEIRSEHRFGEIIGRSPVLKQLTAQMELVAETDSTVLILGETGTGKELVARAIHELSRRRDKPLVKVNCAALPRDLVESELFGHEKGAFTGATQLRRGRFELADGGTLFLDEVGELPLELQVKLLRVLQEQEFERVGGDRTLRTDVRLITATNRDLQGLVQLGEFRSDLYYRLNVFPLRIPPLRERREDIALLIQHFVAGAAKKTGKALTGVDADFLERALRYDWPGNIRELENAIERAAILATGTKLTDAEFIDAPPAPTADGVESIAAMQSLEQVEREHIRRVLKTTHGVIEGTQGAALKLGLKPSTLRGRMRRLGIHKHE